MTTLSFFPMNRNGFYSCPQDDGSIMEGLMLILTSVFLILISHIHIHKYI